VRNGKTDAKQMRRALITKSDLEEAVRKKTGTSEVSAIEGAVLERNGDITVIEKTREFLRTARPVISRPAPTNSSGIGWQERCLSSLISPCVPALSPRKESPMALNQTSGSRMVTGLFPDRTAAERAYDDVSSRGYGHADVNLVMSDETRKRHFLSDGAPETELGTKAAEGAGIGGAIGGSIGAIAAAIAAVGTTIALPGLGLVIAGPLAAAIAGAGAGAATGGIVGALIGWGIPEERVKHYEEGIKNGGILMGVTPRSDDDARYFESQWQRHEGQHVIGTGVGATAGAVAGGSMGAVAGPVGMAAGAAIGAVAGGLAGKGGAEVVNPKADDNRGDHNLAKGVGAGSGAAAGAALGAAGGPVGMAAGAVVGAAAGGLAGKGAAEVANPTPEDRLAHHHLAEGVGAGGGAAAGAAIGAAGGPVGMAAGAALGAVAGSAAGKGTGEVINPKPGDKSPI